MQVESKRGRIPGGSNWAKRSRNAKGKGRRSAELASTKKRQRSVEVPGPNQLLQKVHKGLR